MKYRFFYNCLVLNRYIPESHFVALTLPSNVVGMQHIRINEIMQNRPIQLNMYPTSVWYNAEAIHESINCSSNEMKIVNNQHHAFVNDDVIVLCMYV